MSANAPFAAWNSKNAFCASTSASPAAFCFGESSLRQPGRLASAPAAIPSYREIHSDQSWNHARCADRLGQKGGSHEKIQRLSQPSILSKSVGEAIQAAHCFQLRLPQSHNL